MESKAQVGSNELNPSSCEVTSTLTTGSEIRCRDTGCRLPEVLGVNPGSFGSQPWKSWESTLEVVTMHIHYLEVQDT